MKVELLSITDNAEKLIEEAGRTAYLSHDKAKEGSEKSFIKMLIKRGHESVLEHASATFKITGGSRSFTHQIVRHRLASFTQQSQRYVNEETAIFVVPPAIQKDDHLYKLYTKHMEKVLCFYNHLKEFGVKNEDARFILPNATCSEIVITANLREWRHILKLRGSKHAQWEIRDMACQVYKISKQIVPSIVQDIIYSQKNQTLEFVEL